MPFLVSEKRSSLDTWSLGMDSFVNWVAGRLDSALHHNERMPEEIVATRRAMERRGETMGFMGWILQGSNVWDSRALRRDSP
jgi:hypothetical protein